MKPKLKNIAIVPARIGSKRIKEKNIKLFHGKPIIIWTLETIKKSKIFDKIFISTDSLKIINIKKKYNFNNFINRNKKLSDDYTGTDQVINHAIRELSIEYDLKNIWCIYPCNPFLVKRDLKQALSKLKKNKKLLIFSILEYPHPIERAFFLKKNNRIKYLNINYQKKRTQDFKKKFFDAGKFYFAEKETWKNIRDKNKIGIIQNWWNTADIDDPNDWKKAEELSKIFNKKNLI